MFRKSVLVLCVTVMALGGDQVGRSRRGGGHASAGLWKTVNNGTTWDVLCDDLDDAVSIGDIGINPNDANTVWEGSGENNNRQSGSWGNGLYKSVDGGRTWKNVGLTTSKHIARIIVDPVDHDVVYVAALGSVWGRGGERGVYTATYQRRRATWCFNGGGPGNAMWKSSDAGRGDAHRLVPVRHVRRHAIQSG